MYEEVVKSIDNNLGRSIKDLSEFVRVPSVAAKGEGLEEAASLVERMLKDAGMQTQIEPTSGAQVVTGQWNVGAKRTLLFYDHYDVQPAEPFDLWNSPPFELDEREGRLWGRGAADNKGDTISRISVIKAFNKTGTALPVNVKFVIEGEEEIGSPHLHEYIEKNTDFISADGGIWEFGGADISGLQEAWLGLKGILFVELEIRCLNRNMHSSLACVLPSAAGRLVSALNTLQDEQNRILIKGFYNNITPQTRAELNAIEKIDFNEIQKKKNYGISDYLNGLTGMELKKAYYGNPTCNICGITSGYQGKGSMTVLPATASVKIDFRLVEHMQPDEIKEKLRRHLDSHGFDDVVITYAEGYPAAKTPVDHPFVGIVANANKQIFGDLVVHPTSPGSGPLHLFSEHVPMVSVGCGDHLGNEHSPNESISVDNFRKAQYRIVAIMDEMSHW